MTIIDNINSIEEFHKYKDNIGIENKYDKYTIFYYNWISFYFLITINGLIRINTRYGNLEFIWYNDWDYIGNIYKAIEDIYKKLDEYKDCIVNWEIRIDVKWKTDNEIISLLNIFKMCNIYYWDVRIVEKIRDDYKHHVFLYSKNLCKIINNKRSTFLTIDDFLIWINDLRKLNEDGLDNIEDKYILFDTGELALSLSWLYFIFNRSNEYYKNIPEWYIIINNYNPNCANRLYKLSEVYLCNDCWLSHRKWYECTLWQLDNYHSCTTPIYTKLWKKSKIKLWFEIEKYKQLSPKHIIELKRNNWRAEYDWSVSWWEYITPVLAMHEIPRYFKKFDFIFDYWVNNKCWWHIHFSSSEVPNTGTLYNQMSPFRPLLWSIFHTRTNNTYCNINSIIWQKYRDWNLRSETIEFRIFPWVEKMEDVLFRTELLKFIYNNRIKKSNSNDNYNLARDIIINKIDEIIKIILIRYEKNTVPWIISRLKWYYNIEDNKKISIDKDNNITITDII